MKQSLTYAQGNELAREFTSQVLGEDGKGNIEGGTSLLAFQAHYDPPTEYELDQEENFAHVIHANQMTEQSIWIEHTFYFPVNVRQCVALKRAAQKYRLGLKRYRELYKS